MLAGTGMELVSSWSQQALGTVSDARSHKSTIYLFPSL